METWEIRGDDVEEEGPQEAAETWAADHLEAVGVVIVRDSDGLIAGEWDTEMLR